ncbi:hypothetical protein HZC09_02305 [Candidatus Micrarchaeota archaeon]|nr:hypothetical protein [Candidatus Micrarchaeota archaeon]
MEADYSAEITGETRKELVEFIRWYNHVQGHDPLIVGGWAAWAYHHGLGSKDIDVVFPGAASKQMTLTAYFKSNGYSESRNVDFFDFEFSKTRVASDGRKVKIIVDAVSMDRNVQVSGTELIIPWALAEKHKQRFSFAPGAETYIIVPELLLVYKVGALIGRNHYLRTADVSRQSHYQSKLWKDARDVLGLFENCVFDSKLLFRLLSSCGLSDRQLLDAAAAIGEQQFKDEQKGLFGEKWRYVFGNGPVSTSTPGVRNPRY